MSDALTDNLPTDMSKYNVELTQKTEGWQTTFEFPDNLLGGDTKVADGNTVEFTYADGVVSTTTKLTAE